MLSLRNLSGMLGLTVVSLTACVVTSEETGDPGPSYAHPTEAAFCDALARAQCTDTAVTACYGSGSADLPADKSSCVAKRSATDICRASVTGRTDLASPRYNPDQNTQQCIDAQGAVYADGRIERAELDGAIATCIKIYSGIGGALAPCATDYDCDTTDGLQCVREQCNVPTLVKNGEDCSAPSAECEDPLFYCDAGGSNACLKAKAVGAACSATTPCLPDLNCGPIDPETEMGSCEDKLANGAVCEVSQPSECKGSFCNAPSGHATGECVASLILAGTSASCDTF